MHFIDSSDYRGSSRAAIRAVVPAALLAAAAAVAAGVFWRGAAGLGAACGLGAAWAISSLGVAALFAARKVSSRALWWTFWAGMGSRLAALAGLAAWCAGSRTACAPALLGGYALGVACLLPLELKAVPLR